jgi:hypothetical protein
MLALSQQSATLLAACITGGIAALAIVGSALTLTQQMRKQRENVIEERLWKERRDIYIVILDTVEQWKRRHRDEHTPVPVRALGTKDTAAYLAWGSRAVKYRVRDAGYNLNHSNVESRILHDLRSPTERFEPPLRRTGSERPLVVLPSDSLRPQRRWGWGRRSQPRLSKQVAPATTSGIQD